jgi:hypothetical protein
LLLKRSWIFSFLQAKVGIAVEEDRSVLRQW